MPCRLQICGLALFFPRDYGQQFISAKWTASTWVKWKTEVASSLPLSSFVGSPHLAHLDRRPTGNGDLPPPRECFLQTSGIQHRKTADVLIGFQVWPVGDEHLPTGLHPHRPRAAGRGEASTKRSLDTGSHHLIFERFDIAGHCFVLCGLGVVVWEVNSNQVLRHDFSFVLQRPSGGATAPPSLCSRTAGPELDKSSKKILLFRLINPLGA